VRLQKEPSLSLKRKDDLVGILFGKTGAPAQGEGGETTQELSGSEVRFPYRGRREGLPKGGGGRTQVLRETKPKVKQPNQSLVGLIRWLGGGEKLIPSGTLSTSANGAGEDFSLGVKEEGGTKKKFCDVREGGRDGTYFTRRKELAA